MAGPNEPRKFVEYPKMLYRRANTGGVETLTVDSAKDEEDAIVAGWVIEAPAPHEMGQSQSTTLVDGKMAGGAPAQAPAASPSEVQALKDQNAALMARLDALEANASAKNTPTPPQPPADDFYANDPKTPGKARGKK